MLVPGKRMTAVVVGVEGLWIVFVVGTVAVEVLSVLMQLAGLEFG